MFNKIIILAIVIGFIATSAYCLRVNLPPVLSLPITDSQVSQLNQYLKDIWNIQNGRFELDVVTTSKTAAKNGEIWVYQNVGAGTYYIQTRAGGTVRSVALTP